MAFDFAKDYVLENKRVKLEPMTTDHVELLRKVSEEQGLWTYFLGSSNGYGRFAEYVSEALMVRRNKKGYPFAIFDKEKNSYAGSTRFFDYQESLCTIRLGYTWYGGEFRGTGLNKNCKYLMFQFAFEELDMERIGLGAHAENKVSIAAMRSVGCKEEGSIRNLFPSMVHKGRSDGILFGMLKQEWFNDAKENLKLKL